MVIGNNKFKSFYVKENLVHHLIEILNRFFLSNARLSASQLSLNSSDQLDLVNEILVVLASFALGSIENIIKIIKVHNLHQVIFSMIRQSASSLFSSCPTNAAFKPNLKIVESGLRCLSNLYSSSQLVPSLVFFLDQVIYTGQSLSSGLDILHKVFPLSNLTKQTVINIVSISSSSITYSLTSTSRYIAVNMKAHSNKRPSRLYRLDEELRKRRSLLISTECVSKFCTLLTSFQPVVQLNTLKFYASICFENFEASKEILKSSYYEYSLLDLISSYLSRENSSELQLYAAQCLTNLCRSIPSQHCSIKCKNEFLFDESSNEMCEEETSELKQEHEITKLSFSSQLIRLKTLPTLVRLCCSYSHSYRNSRCSSSKANLSDMNQLFLIKCVSTLTYLIELNPELQSTAIYLEQLIPTLAHNVLDAFCSLDTQRKTVQFPNQIKTNLINKNEVNLKKRRLFTCSETANKKINRGKSFESNGNLRTEPNLTIFSLLYLNYNLYASNSLLVKSNEYQFRRLSLITLDPLIPLTFSPKKVERYCSKVLAKIKQNLSIFAHTMHKRLACICLHALATLSSNNEDARRQISDNPALIARLIESFQMSEERKSEETLRMSGLHLKIDDLIVGVKVSFSELVTTGDEMKKEEVTNEDGEEELINDLEEDFEDMDQTEANLTSLSGLCLLHSLCRSVHQLRTKFLDNKIWTPILELTKRSHQKWSEKRLLSKRRRILRVEQMEQEKQLKSIRISKKRGTDASIQMSNLDENEKFLAESAELGFNQIFVKENPEEELEEDEESDDDEPDYDGTLKEQSLLSILTAILANLVLEFSPSREVNANN